MSRSVSVVLALLAGALVAFLALRMIAPRPMAPPEDADALASLDPDVVLQKCNGATFDTTNASDTLTIETGVIIRIFPNSRGHQNRMEHLQRGRVLAKVRNEGTQDYPRLALTAGGEACWAVKEENNRMVSKFVSLTNSSQMEQPEFVIDLHSGTHPGPRAEWRRYPRDTGQQAPARPAVRLISSVQMLTDPWMWVSCLSNGCCRSRT